MNDHVQLIHTNRSALFWTFTQLGFYIKNFYLFVCTRLHWSINKLNDFRSKQHDWCVRTHHTRLTKCVFVIKLNELALIAPIRTTTSSLNEEYARHPRPTISQSAAEGPLPFQRVSTLRAGVTLKTSEVGLFNYCVLMIKWEQHNGLINFLITVSTKSNYNQIHRLANHTSIKLKQSPLGSNHFQNRTNESIGSDLRLRTGKCLPKNCNSNQRLLRLIRKLWNARRLNRNSVCTISTPAWARPWSRASGFFFFCAKTNHYGTQQSRPLCEREAAIKCQYNTQGQLDDLQSRPWPLSTHKDW